MPRFPQVAPKRAADRRQDHVGRAVLALRGMAESKRWRSAEVLGVLASWSFGQLGLWPVGPLGSWAGSGRVTASILAAVLAQMAARRGVKLGRNAGRGPPGSGGGKALVWQHDLTLGRGRCAAAFDPFGASCYGRSQVIPPWPLGDFGACTNWKKRAKPIGGRWRRCMTCAFHPRAWRCLLTACATECRQLRPCA